MILLLLLVQLLASPSFRQREAALSAFWLIGDNRFALDLLEHYEAHHPALEARRRCTYLVDRWYQAGAEQMAAKLGRMPWIDGGICGYSDLLQLARVKVPGDHGPHWRDWAAATRLWVAQRIAARLPWQETVRDLWRREWAYRWRHLPDWWCW